MLTTQNTISVGKLTAQIKSILEGNFENIAVSGEISNFKNHFSGHMYFTLKDETAEIKTVMFKGFNQYLRFKPEDGMHVFASGRLTVYEQRGQYQLNIKQMEPAGLGTLYLAFEKLKKQLAQEGMFDEDRKKILPTFPIRIGVITSKSGAAFQDIINILQRRAPFVKIILRATKVQGAEAAADIADAIADLNKFGDVDVIILGRGGGSIEDLWSFNEEIVARAISQSQIPIISAVGHETDFSIADLVADKRAPTPSAAAEIVIPSAREINEICEKLMLKIETYLTNLLERTWQKLDDMSSRVFRQQPQKVIQLQKTELEKIENRLTNSVRQNRQLWDMKLNPVVERLISLSPTSILDRGYSMAIRSTDQQIILAAQDLKINETFDLVTSRGSLTAKRIKKLVQSNIKQ